MTLNPNFSLDHDVLFKHGTLLFSNETLADSPGGSEKLYILLYLDEFYAADDSQILSSGTHFHDVSEDPFTVFQGKVTIQSLLHSAGELAQLLDVERLEEGDRVTINDVEFEMKDGRLDEA